MIYILEHSLLEHFLTIVKNNPTHSHFRYGWKKISDIVATLVTKDFPLEEKFDEDGNFLGYKFSAKYSIVSIFPYGIRLSQSFANILPDSSLGYPGYSTDNDVVEENLCILPDELAKTNVLICDALLKTGETAKQAISRLQIENVSEIKLVTVFATTEGIENVRGEFPEVPIYVCSLDNLEEIEKLTYLEPFLHYYNL
ncbi:MAG: uracil phosphoribosyltransferase [Candidatus Kapaibacteriota bacterium]